MWHLQVEDLSAAQQRLEGECRSLTAQLAEETSGRQREAAVAASAEQAAELRSRNDRLAEQNAQLEVGSHH
jgi:ubiquinone biosynthesis protein UbiJ